MNSVIGVGKGFGPPVADMGLVRRQTQAMLVDEGANLRQHGIGLFAARRLMDAMGGRIFLEPNGYASSRFVVALPAGS